MVHPSGAVRVDFRIALEILFFESFSVLWEIIVCFSLIQDLHDNFVFDNFSHKNV